MRALFSILAICIGMAPSLAQKGIDQSIKHDSIVVHIRLPDDREQTVNISDIITGTDRTSVLYDQYGNAMDYTFFANKVVLLDFWYLRCPPCIVELPGMELLKKKVASTDFVLLTFCIESYAAVEATLFNNRTFQLPVIPQTKMVSHRVYPVKALFNRQGELIDLATSGSISEDSVQRLIDKYYPLITEAL